MTSISFKAVTITALLAMVVNARYFDPIHNATVEKTLQGVQMRLNQQTNILDRRFTNQAKQTDALDKTLTKQAKGTEMLFARQTKALETRLGALEQSMTKQTRQFLSAISALSSQHQDLLHSSVTFLRRQDGSVDFYRNWADYKAGFGDRNGEFWLGLDRLHQLTSSNSYKLRVDLTDWSGEHKWAEYATFRVASEASKFKLTVSGYNSASTAADNLGYNNGMYFSTRERDNDRWEKNCAADYSKGGWWYKSCHSANPTGLYKPANYNGWDGINWYNAYMDWRSFKEVSLKLIKA